MRSTVHSALLLLLLLALPSTGHTTDTPATSSSGWLARVAEHSGLPARFVAVDKEQQRLFLFNHNSPLELTADFTCTTGQAVGAKQDEGDLKTPEGVYFVEGHITGGLDFGLYGNEAYPLNYPNPIDRLRARSGYGIWIHGRGRTLVPRDTQGCVAMNNADLTTLGPSLQPGTPVMLAQTISASPRSAATPAQRALHDAPQAGTAVEGTTAQADELLKLSTQWATAWANRDSAMLDMYNPTAYSASSGSFAQFAATKKRLFRNLPWIINWIDDVQALQGPGYWVTWFSQYYRAPNLTVQGQRRLYWLADASGRMRIAGMEWRPLQNNLEDRYLAAVQPDVLAVIEKWRAAWESGDLPHYMNYYTEDARQDARGGLDAIRLHKQSVWASAHPKKVQLDAFRFSVGPEGLSVTMRQRYSSSGGYSDSGVKTLTLHPHDNTWRIAREDWRAL